MTIQIWIICSKPANLRDFRLGIQRVRSCHIQDVLPHFLFDTSFLNSSVFPLFCSEFLPPKHPFFSPLRGCQQQESCCTSRSADRGDASPCPVMSPSRLRWKTHTNVYNPGDTHCSNHFADSHLLAQTRFLIPRFLEA